MFYDVDTGRKISSFTVDELIAHGCAVGQAMWLVMGIPFDQETSDTVCLVSVDGFRIRYEEKS